MVLKNENERERERVTPEKGGELIVGEIYRLPLISLLLRYKFCRPDSYRLRRAVPWLQTTDLDQSEAAAKQCQNAPYFYFPQKKGSPVDFDHRVNFIYFGIFWFYGCESLNIGQIEFKFEKPEKQAK